MKQLEINVLDMESTLEELDIHEESEEQNYDVSVSPQSHLNLSISPQAQLIFISISFYSNLSLISISHLFIILTSVSY